MTPMDLFMFGLYSGIFWLALVLVFTIIGAVGDSFDRLDGAMAGFVAGGIIGISGFVITIMITWGAAIVLAIINALG